MDSPLENVRRETNSARYLLTCYALSCDSTCFGGIQLRPLSPFAARDLSWAREARFSRASMRDLTRQYFYLVGSVYRHRQSVSIATRNSRFDEDWFNEEELVFPLLIFLRD